MISLNEIRNRAIVFAHEWERKYSEDAEAKSFWDGLSGADKFISN